MHLFRERLDLKSCEDNVYLFLFYLQCIPIIHFYLEQELTVGCMINGARREKTNGSRRQ